MTISIGAEKAFHTIEHPFSVFFNCIQRIAGNREGDIMHGREALGT